MTSGSEGVDSDAWAHGGRGTAHGEAVDEEADADGAQEAEGGDLAFATEISDEADEADEAGEAGEEQDSLDGEADSDDVGDASTDARGAVVAALSNQFSARELLERFRRWVYGRHEEVQDYTAGFVVTVDYVGRRNADGHVPCYGDFLAAQRAAIQVMHQDALVIAVPCDVERYKRALDEQLRWIETILPEVLMGSGEEAADASRRRKRRSR